MTSLQHILINQWYQPKPWGWLLWPCSKLFEVFVKLRVALYQKGILRSYKAQVPVIIVGNLTVGGTGKTPLVMALAELLRQQGLHPGIVLRGYKSNAVGAIIVQTNMDPKLVGDEALLLAKRCACPVVVAKKRVAGVKKLIQACAVNVILCDDGLQHYALQRDLEIAVIDGERGFGNGRSLPMGPLRELPQRLQKVNLTVTNGADMHLTCAKMYSLLNNKRTMPITDLAGKTVHAIAGIGTPKKFFKLLSDQGLTVIPHEFPDHHKFSMSDLVFPDRLPILMTEKDAVKCGYFASDRYWVVPVDTVLSDNVKEQFTNLVQGVLYGR
ncbi:MAG TPA: tetraacyldisaccharide 4'-kinase [Gammaproteobacteria bacterium]|nr:tetraacyldisaccharide 4'-kinase [Gammaproteobacteria bacterium]